jgi:tetratricopeptide (TPR) repeat protein
MKYNKFSYQSVISYCAWVVLGLCALGVLLDSLGNAIAIITPTITYWGTTSAIIFCSAAIIYIRKRPIPWKLKDGQIIMISRLNISFYLYLAGMITLLWLPRFVPHTSPILAVISLNDTPSTPHFVTSVNDNGQVSLFKWDQYYKIINNSRDGILVSDLTLLINTKRTSLIQSQSNPHIELYETNPFTEAGEINTPHTSSASYPFSIKPYSELYIKASFWLYITENGVRVSLPYENLENANSKIISSFGVSADSLNPVNVTYKLTITSKLDETYFGADYNIDARALLLGLESIDGLTHVNYEVEEGDPIGIRDNNHVLHVMCAGIGKSYELLSHKSEEYILQYINDNPSDINGYLVLALMYHENEEYEQAESILTAFKPNSDTDKVIIKNNLGAIACDTGNFAKGRAYFEEAISLSTCNNTQIHIAYYNLKEYYVYLKDYENVLLITRNAFSECDQHIALWAGELSYWIKHSKKISDDVNLLLNTIKKSPSNGDLYYYVSEAYKAAGDLDNSVLYLDKAIEFGSRRADQANTWVRYQPCSLTEILRFFDSTEEARQGESIFTKDELPSKVEVTYTGKSRKISSSRKEHLEQWLNYRGCDCISIDDYTVEWLFIENSIEYWIPVQKNPASFFSKELKKGENVTLFVVFTGVSSNLSQEDFIFIANEFNL